MPTTALVTTQPFSVGFDTEIRIGDTRIPYCLRDEAGTAPLGRRLRRLDADRFLLVVDDTLRRHPMVGQLHQELAEAAPKGCQLLTLHADEQAKTMAAVTRLLEGMAAAGATRNTVMVIVGGGLTSNVAGLAAALYIKGAVRVVEVPTTPLAWWDSTLSAKRGVNVITQDGSVVAKNLAGQWHPAVLVWVDLAAWLPSLPRVQIRSGTGEIVKNTLAIAPDHYDEVAGLLTPDATYTASQYERLILLAIDANTRVMRDDPREEASGLTRTYGHEVGHALELASGGRVPHGLAVGVGMHAAALLAHRLGLLARQDVDAHVELLSRAGAPTRLPASVTPEDVLRGVGYGNTRGLLRAEIHGPERPPRHAMVLLEGLGAPRCDPEEARPLTLVAEADLHAVLRDLAA